MVGAVIIAIISAQRLTMRPIQLAQDGREAMPYGDGERDLDPITAVCQISGPQACIVKNLMLRRRNAGSATGIFVLS